MQANTLENTLLFNGEVVTDKSELMSAVNIWLDDEAGEEFFEFDNKIISTFSQLKRIIEQNYERGEELTDRITQPKLPFANYNLVRVPKVDKVVGLDEEEVPTVPEEVRHVDDWVMPTNEAFDNNEYEVKAWHEPKLPDEELEIERLYSGYLEHGESIEDLFKSTQEVYDDKDYLEELKANELKELKLESEEPKVEPTSPIYCNWDAIDLPYAEVHVDMVNHPPHYKQGTLETIDYMDVVFGTRALYIYCVINSFKYNSRAPYKGKQEEDTEKAQWYLNKAEELKSKLGTDEEILAPINII